MATTLPTVITGEDLIVEEGQEPRILDMRLAQALGFKRPADIRPLIDRHLQALDQLGGIFRTVRKNPGRGRPATEYRLTKKQALYLCTKSETERATDITIQIVEVFDAVTSQQAVPVPLLTRGNAPTLPPMSDDLLRGADAIADYLGMTRRQVYHLSADRSIPTFKMGATVCARKSTLVMWMVEQERLVFPQPLPINSER